MSKIRPKLCPFCRGRAFVDGKYSTAVSVVCKICFARTTFFKTEQEAIAAWNKRYEGGKDDA